MLITKMLGKCKQIGISHNPKKCAFYVNSSVLLRHIICSDGLLMDPIKITIITTMPILVNATICFFLGVVDFY